MSGVSVGDVFTTNPEMLSQRRLRVERIYTAWDTQYADLDLVGGQGNRTTTIRVDRLLSSRYRRVERNET